jgi:MurNAc alpha-1-phosphate uridylyltransferase
MSSGMLPVVILAGGLATRLQPLTQTIPKALIDVNGKPFIVHQLRLLRTNGVERVIVCAGYLGEMIQEYIGTGERFGLRVEFAFDGPQLLGTAGCIKKALPALGHAFFALYGDSYLPCEYHAVQTAFQGGGRQALMTVFRNDGCWDRSNVEFVGGQILSYNKQHPAPQMRHIDYGLGVFNQSAFGIIPGDQPYDLETLYQVLLKQGDLAAFEVSQRFYEVGSFAGLEETRQYLAGQAFSQKGIP